MKINDLDPCDVAILRELQADGRVSNVELAWRVHLSPPAVHTRLRRLEREGFVHQYAAVLSRERLGYDMLCFVHVVLQRHQPEVFATAVKAIRQMAEVLECHQVTGDFDLLLKVAIRNKKDLDDFFNQKLTPVPGIARVNTSIVLREVKFTTALPLK